VGEETLYDLFSEYCHATKRSKESLGVNDTDVSEFIEWLYDKTEEGSGLEDDFSQGHSAPRTRHNRTLVSSTDEDNNNDDSSDCVDEKDEGKTRGARIFIDLAATDEEEEEESSDGIECDSSDQEFDMPRSLAPPQRGLELPARRTTQQTGIDSFFSARPADPLQTQSRRNVQKTGTSGVLVDAARPSRMEEFTEHHSAAQSLAHHRRPATAAEAQLDDLDYANRFVFGNDTFRPRQREIISAALAKRDVFVLMPTGGGKSLCYQLPAVISPGVTVVITPLLSLMQDQVQALCNAPGGGVPATYLSSQQTPTEAHAVHMELAKDRPTVKLLYVTPEQLAIGAKLRDRLEKLNSRGLFSRLVVDECHCVSQWGHGRHFIVFFFFYRDFVDNIMKQ